MAFTHIVDQDQIMHAQKKIRKRDRNVILTHFRHLFVLYSSCLACSTNSFFTFFSDIYCKKAAQTVNGKTMSNGQEEEKNSAWNERDSKVFSEI